MAKGVHPRKFLPPLSISKSAELLKEELRSGRDRIWLVVSCCAFQSVDQANASLKMPLESNVTHKALDDYQ